MPIDPDDLKAAVKEALREWVDEKYKEFGRWSFMGLVAFLLAGFVYMIFWFNGWRLTHGG